jgi:glycerol-3-phosphate responsive antiterminator
MRKVERRALPQAVELVFADAIEVLPGVIGMVGQ